MFLTIEVAVSGELRGGCEAAGREERLAARCTGGGTRDVRYVHLRYTLRLPEVREEVTATAVDR